MYQKLRFGLRTCAQTLEEPNFQETVINSKQRCPKKTLNSLGPNSRPPYDYNRYHQT